MANQTDTITTTGEREDLLQSLAKSRHFLRFTARTLTDEQAAERPTASALCIGGLIKHVAAVESGWVDFILGGAATLASVSTEFNIEDRMAQFRMEPGDTLAGVLSDYQRVADRTDEVVAGLPDLGVSHLLPEAPWFEKGARWSARRVVVHIVAETAQHAGHADIIRESIDGSKSMG